MTGSSSTNPIERPSSNMPKDLSPKRDGNREARTSALVSRRSDITSQLLTEPLDHPKAQSRTPVERRCPSIRLFQILLDMSGQPAAAIANANCEPVAIEHRREINRPLGRARFACVEQKIEDGVADRAGRNIDRALDI